MSNNKRLKDVIELQNTIGDLVAKIDRMTVLHEARCIEYEVLIIAYRGVVDVVRRRAEFQTPALYNAELDYRIRMLDRIVQEEGEQK